MNILLIPRVCDDDMRALTAALSLLQCAWKDAAKAEIRCQLPDYEDCWLAVPEARKLVRVAAAKCGLDLDILVEAFNG